jgi:hypothetical protein
MIKTVIIIVLKSDLRSTRHQARVELINELGQCKDKKDHYHSFKTRPGDQPGAKLGSRVELIIDPS